MLSPSRDVSRLLTDTASRHPERTAIVFGEDHIRYAALDAAAKRVANLLVSRGIQPGDKDRPVLPQPPALLHRLLPTSASSKPAPRSCR
ncbi:AMP-binding protein [Streptomyces sp. NBC_00582]|nr:AMP-binding protein [Streptomyces sp. NBC_00582]